MAGLASFVENRDVFKYERPFNCIGFEGVDWPQRNVSLQELPLPNLTDLRSLPKSEWPSLSKNLFCFAHQHSDRAAADVTEENSQALAEEVGTWLKEFLAAETVVPGAIVLRSTNKAHGKGPHLTSPHLDFGKHSGWKNAMTFLSQEHIDSILSGRKRARIINVWRPVLNPSEDYPLALLDPNTVDESQDFLTVDKVTPERAVSAYMVRYDPSHRWYWLGNQTPDEVIVFSMWDTHPPDGFSGQIAHSAFRNENARPGCPPRQSVEIRYIVLTPAPYKAKLDFVEDDDFDTRRRPWKEHIGVPSYYPKTGKR